MVDHIGSSLDGTPMVQHGCASHVVSALTIIALRRSQARNGRSAVGHEGLMLVIHGDFDCQHLCP